MDVAIFKWTFSASAVEPSGQQLWRTVLGLMGVMSWGRVSVVQLEIINHCCCCCAKRHLPCI